MIGQLNPRSERARARARDRAQLTHLAEALEPRRLLAVNPLGPEFRVNTFTPDIQRYPDVAMDADGDFVVAWEGYGHPADQSEAAAMVQRYTSTGAPAGGEFRAN